MFTVRHKPAFFFVNLTLVYCNMYQAHAFSVNFMFVICFAGMPHRTTISEICFLCQLRPGMERYQQPMVNIMTRRATPQQGRVSNGASCEVSNSGCSAITPTTATTLTCPAGTPQDPSYLTIPFTSPSGEPMSPIEPKRPKEQEASMFVAGTDSQLIVGMAEHSVTRVEQFF